MWAPSARDPDLLAYELGITPLSRYKPGEYRKEARLRRRHTDWVQGNTTSHRLAGNRESPLFRSVEREAVFKSSEFWRSSSSGRRKPLPLITMGVNLRNLLVEFKML